jgi:hypothetical protein
MAERGPKNIFRKSIKEIKDAGAHVGEHVGLETGKGIIGALTHSTLLGMAGGIGGALFEAVWEEVKKKREERRMQEKPEEKVVHRRVASELGMVKDAVITAVDLRQNTKGKLLRIARAAAAGATVGYVVGRLIK